MSDNDCTNPISKGESKGESKEKRKQRKKLLKYLKIGSYVIGGCFVLYKLCELTYYQKERAYYERKRYNRDDYIRLGLM